MALVEQSDVEAALVRPLTDAEANSIGPLCNEVTAMLRRRRPTIDARMERFTVAPADPFAVDPVLVAATLARVIKRFLSNVSGAASVTDGVGPFPHSVSYASYGRQLGPNGELEITDDDLAKIDPPSEYTPGVIRTRPSMHGGGRRW